MPSLSLHFSHFLFLLPTRRTKEKLVLSAAAVASAASFTHFQVYPEHTKAHIPAHTHAHKSPTTKSQRKKGAEILVQFRVPVKG